MGAKITRQELIDDILRVYMELGKAPLTTQYEYLGHFSISRVRSEFGSWRNALVSCNINPTSDNRKINSDSDLINEIDRLTILLGRNPSYTDIKENGTISTDTFVRRLGKSNFKNPKDILNTLDKNWNVNNISQEHGYTISGFTSGEGCFILRNNGNLSFRIGLRIDDIDILKFIRNIMNLPVEIYTHSNSTRRQQGQKAGDEARLVISNRWIVKERVIPFFDKFSLIGRKQLDYEIFKLGVIFMCNRTENGMNRKRLIESEKQYLNELASKLKSLRKEPSCFAE